MQMFRRTVGFVPTNPSLVPQRTPMSHHMNMISYYVSEIFNEEKNNYNKISYRSHELWGKFINHLEKFSKTRGILIVRHFRHGGGSHFEPIIHYNLCKDDFVTKHQSTLSEQDMIEEYIPIERTT